MASFKDLIVNGVSRFVGKVYSSGGFVGNLTGIADKAEALTTDAGNMYKPVYVFNGKLQECQYTINKSVPSTAVFSDTKRGVEGISSATTRNPTYDISYVLTAAVTLTMGTSSTPVGTVVYVCSTIAGSKCTFPNTAGTSQTVTFVVGSLMMLVRAGSGYAYLMHNAIWN